MSLIKKYPSNYEEFLAGFQLDIPANYNFAFDFLDAAALEDPTRPAMVHVGPDGTRAEYDLAFFSRESSRLAHALQKLGIGKGDAVMLLLFRRVEFWTTALALHKLGAVPVPSTSLLTPKDIEYRVNRAQIRGVVTDASLAERVDAVRDSCPSLTVLVQVGPPISSTSPAPGWKAYEDIRSDAPDTFPKPSNHAGGEDPLIIFFTSGTSGPPKMAELTHVYPLGHAATGIYWHDLEPGDLHLTLADTGWAKAAWGKFYGQWLAQATIFVWDLRGKFVPAELLQVLEDHKVTGFCAPPTVYRHLIREDLASYDLSSLKHCTTAGELLNDSVFHAWKDATGLGLYEGYGQTETCLQVATYPFMEPKPGSMGKPAPGWNVVLLDDQDQPCPPDAEGELCLKLEPGKNIGLFAGYKDEPERTAAAFQGGYYHTGDKAWMDKDGYYWFMGRIDDLIKTSGYRVGPFEVESALVSHPAVVEAAVTGVPDEIRGQIVKATITLAPGWGASEDLTLELQNHVKKNTAPYKYPRLIEYVGELPKTISGKIKRAEIRAKSEG